MNRPETDRRNFLKSSAAAAAAGWIASGTAAMGRAGQPAAKVGTVRLGAPVFDAPQDPEELALAHRKLGYRAAYCPAVGLNDKDRIREISAACPATCR